MVTPVKIRWIAIVCCCLTVALAGGCQDRRGDLKKTVNVISAMATAAAKGDYVSGIAIGENYLREKPRDSNVLEQTAVLTLAQAKQDQNNRGPLVVRAVLLLERSVASSHSPGDSAERFANRFEAARGFEQAGDLSSDKCPYYKRALALNSEAEAVLSVESCKLQDGEAISTKPLKEQSRRLQSELEKRMSESRCRS